jgi:virginiamycin B lyase
VGEAGPVADAADRFAVALSYASEDRPYVRRVAAALRRLGIASFYDGDLQAELWGRDLTIQLEQVFRRQSRLVVVFASAHYAAKMWPRHELRSALARAVESRGEFLLPARFDDTEVPGLLPTLAYVDCRRTTPRQLAQLIAAKVRGLAPPTDALSGRSAAEKPPPLARRAVRLALPRRWHGGMLAGAVVVAMVVAALLWSLSRPGRPVATGPSPRSVVMEFALPAGVAQPTAIARGPSGSLWFGLDSDRIGQIVSVGAQTGWTNDWSIRTRGANPVGIATGVGAFWFTEYGAAKIGRMTIAGAISEYPTPTPDSGPDQIALGPGSDHSLWFTERLANRIGRITTAGVITEYALSPRSRPMGITGGPDGALWFTEPGTGRIGRMAVDGTLAEFPLPPSSAPTSIIDGGDGTLWFAEPGSDRLGRIRPDGQVEWVAIPTPASGPARLAVGMDDSIWFTEQAARKIGHVLPDGRVEERAVPETPLGIAIGADGYVWFTENGAGRIGRLGARIETRPQPSTTPALPLGEPSSDPCRHKIKASDGAAQLLPTPWVLDVTPPDQSGDCDQGVPAGALLGRKQVSITFDLHGLRASPDIDSSIVVEQGGNDQCRDAAGCRYHYVSLFDYERNGGYGRQTITVPLSAFPGLDVRRPTNGVLHVRFHSTHAFYVEISSIIVG